MSHNNQENIDPLISNNTSSDPPTTAKLNLHSNSSDEPETLQLQASQKSENEDSNPENAILDTSNDPAETSITENSADSDMSDHNNSTELDLNSSSDTLENDRISAESGETELTLAVENHVKTMSPKPVTELAELVDVETKSGYEVVETAENSKEEIQNIQEKISENEETLVLTSVKEDLHAGRKTPDDELDENTALINGKLETGEEVKEEADNTSPTKQDYKEKIIEDDMQNNYGGDDDDQDLDLLNLKNKNKPASVFDESLDIKKRVKVYMLSSARQWDDKGTGYIGQGFERVLYRKSGF